MRVTPENITKVNENEVFVFGSNESGRHGKEAAKTALGFGAKYGQAAGLQGKTYGISTKDYSIRNTLSIEKINLYVISFIAFTKIRKDLTFYVTEIGCGLAGYSPEEIAPLFKECINMENVYLPERFIYKI